MYRSHSSAYFLALAASVLAACSDDATPLAPEEPTPAASEVERRSDGPAANGRIVFSAPAAGGLDIFSVNSDATDLRNLTLTGGPNEHSPAVSPDGRKIAYAARVAGVDDVNRDFDLYVMSSNGRNLRRLLGGPVENGDDQQPSWSPDGTRIAFTRIPGPGRIMTVKADGSDVQEFATCTDGCVNPAWAPDGGAIAYETAGRLEVKTANQAPQVLAINLRPSAGGPAWSLDASKLVYPGVFGEGPSPRLMVVNRDGSGHAPIITGADTAEQDPAWGPVR